LAHGYEIPFKNKKCRSLLNRGSGISLIVDAHHSTNMPRERSDRSRLLLPPFTPNVNACSGWGDRRPDASASLTCHRNRDCLPD
jgi:hypothetical protein